MKGKGKVVFEAGVLILLTLSTLLPISTSQEQEKAIITAKPCSTQIQEEKPKLFEGTILDGSKKVAVTIDGSIRDGFNPNYFDYVLSFEEYEKIADDAYVRYFEKYGIDLRPKPKQQSPIVQLRELIRIKNSFSNDGFITSSTNGGPHQINGHMIVEWFIASDDVHEPYNPDDLLYTCIQGWRRFEIFDIMTLSAWYFGVWDASDVGTDYWDILTDFAQDWESWNWPTDDSHVNMGLVKKSNHNGAAYIGGFFGFVAERVQFISINHAKDRIAQHELTHCIGGIPDDNGWWPWNHHWKRCIVNYFWLWIGTTSWCDTCSNTINNNIWSN